MKNFKTYLLTFLLLISMCLVACGDKSDSTEKDASIDYDQEYDSIIESISTMNEGSNYITSVVMAVWQEAGASEAGSCLVEMLSPSCEDDCLNMSVDSLSNIIDAFGIDDSKSWEYQCDHGGNYAKNLQKFGVLKQIYEYCSTYQDKYYNVYNSQNDIKASIKTLKQSVDSEHSDAIEALEEYYLKSCSYADWALNPSGNLINYSSSCSGYKNELSELKTKAEFEK